MNRPLLIPAAAALVLGLVVAFYNPDVRPAGSLTVPDSPTPVSSASLAPARAQDPGTAAPQVMPDEPLESAPPEETLNTGPVTVDLGGHTLYLKDPTEGRVARLRLKVVGHNEAVAREVRLRRSELLRMLYFLASHREAEGALGEAGRDRFASDLLDRFRNVVRTGPIDELQFEGYEVVPRPAPGHPQH